MIDDEDFAAEVAARPPQEQAIVLGSGKVRRFIAAQVVAHLKDNMKFTKNGDVEITLVIPHEFKHLSFPLTDAFGLPLSVDIRVWEPYTKAEETGEATGGLGGPS